jgi:hypothetical protein
MEPWEEFNETLRQIAEVFFQAVVDSEAEDLGWSQAYCDVRYSLGGIQIKKFRVELTDGSQVSTDTPDGSEELFDRLWSLRDSGLIQDWFGLRMVINPTGNCSTTFNFDPKCIGDPAFFQD